MQSRGKSEAEAKAGTLAMIRDQSIIKAEAELERNAIKSGQSTEELKLSLTRRFDLWFEEQSQAAKSTTSSLTTAPAPAGPGVN